MKDSKKLKKKIPRLKTRWKKLENIEQRSKYRKQDVKCTTELQFLHSLNKKTMIEKLLFR